MNLFPIQSTLRHEQLCRECTQEKMKHGRNKSSRLVKSTSINWLNLSGDIGKIFLIIIFFCICIFQKHGLRKHEHQVCLCHLIICLKKMPEEQIRNIYDSGKEKITLMISDSKLSISEINSMSYPGEFLLLYQIVILKITL